MKTILFTGGHHNSALEVVLELNKNENHKKYRIVWVGRKYAPNDSELSPEFKDISPHVQAFHNIHAGKLHRIRSLKYVPKFIAGVALVPVGFFQSLFIIMKEQPNLVVSWGGYIALPIVLVAKILKIKTITHEQTLTLGLANHIISGLVDKIYTAWPVKYYPHGIQSKCVYVGLPLRQINTTTTKLFPSDDPILLVMGGKMGSHFINKVVMDNLAELTKSYNIVWSCGLVKGEFSKDNILAKLTSSSTYLTKVLVKDYFSSSEMANIMPQVDIAFSRSGGHTIYEYIAFRIKCLLCPLPISSKNEQYKNAELVEEIGLGEIMREEEYSSGLFLDRLAKIREYNVEKISDKFQIIRDANKKLSAEIWSLL